MRKTWKESQHYNNKLEDILLYSISRPSFVRLTPICVLLAAFPEYWDIQVAVLFLLNHFILPS
jgi:hypothetical protein